MNDTIDGKYDAIIGKYRYFSICDEIVCVRHDYPTDHPEYATTGINDPIWKDYDGKTPFEWITIWISYDYTSGMHIVTYPRIDESISLTWWIIQPSKPEKEYEYESASMVLHHLGKFFTAVCIDEKPATLEEAKLKLEKLE
jgi:hypothetical protein